MKAYNPMDELDIIPFLDNSVSCNGEKKKYENDLKIRQIKAVIKDHEENDCVLSDTVKTIKLILEV